MLLEMSQSMLIQTLLFGDSKFMTLTNSHILNGTVDFLLLTKRFEDPVLKGLSLRC